MTTEDDVLDLYGNIITGTTLDDYTAVTSEDYSDYTALLPIEQHELSLLSAAISQEELQLIESRWDDLRIIQGLYPTFDLFLQDMYEELFPAFNCTAVQLDIADYLQSGPLYRMIQAQRGQAKTTITAAYAVWRILHNPKTRVLIFSAGGDMASQIALWVIQIIQGMAVLEPLRPDVGNRNKIQRSSVSAFDVHWALKGPEKSPSVACLGITANMQGFRSDLLIADDIESSKNALTEVTREQLDQKTLDFPSICSTGDIVYLGTPQSCDSIYNRLPERGFNVRIWSGRYPTVEEEENYGPHLAPAIKKAMLRDPLLREGGGPTGKRGKPTDPVLLGEEILTKKEIAQTAAYFQLQHMLDTRLTDELRFPLKARDLLVMDMDTNTHEVPVILRYVPEPARAVVVNNGAGVREVLYRPYIQPDTIYLPLTNGRTMYIDPAGGGQNGDETSYSISSEYNGYVYLFAVGGVGGGHSVDKLEELSRICLHWKVNHVEVEQNYGHGSYITALRPVVQTLYATSNLECTFGDVYNTGQKEVRIADTLEPLIASHKLVINEKIIKYDITSTEHYPVSKRQGFQFFHQLTKLTREKGSLIHDDRLEAVCGAVHYWRTRLGGDQQASTVAHHAAEYIKFVSNPLQRNELIDITARCGSTPKKSNNVFTKFKTGVFR